ncbi:MAG: site-2 protease family protein [Propionibacteriaceae bacterium]|nr:site-2 protease family protein [Propionibacteriaceae bacterium]
MTDTIIKIVGALIFFALILLSVTLHELGHFIPGKLFKVKVLQFFLGFGKNLWKTKRGETEYGVKMIPLGGYVLMQGMYPPKREGKNTWLKRVADSAREAEWENITQADVASGRLFFQKPLWQRMIIMFSGVFTNLLLAFVLFLGVNMTFGMNKPIENSMEIEYVQQCQQPAPEPCVPTPASAMGLQAGDVLVEFNGQPYASWDLMTQAIRANGDAPVRLVVNRDGKRTELHEVPGMVGPTVDPADPTQTIEAGKLGVIRADSKFERAGPIETLKQMWFYTTESVKAIGKLPVTAVKVLSDMITGKPRDINSPISILGASVIAGEVASAEAPAGARVAFYVQLLASVNLFVGLINLVPLPPFDGGQVAAGVYESIRRRIMKLRGKADPGPADTARLLPVTYVVGGMLVLIGVILILADIISPVALF